MSHFTRIKTQLYDRTNLRQSLEELVPVYHYDLSEGNVQVRGYNGQTMQCEFKLDMHNGEYDLGFRRESAQSEYELIGDFWIGGKLSNFQQEEFVDAVSQQYAYHTVKEEMEKLGFQLREEKLVEETEDSSICLTYRGVF